MKKIIKKFFALSYLDRDNSKQTPRFQENNYCFVIGKAQTLRNQEDWFTRWGEEAKIKQKYPSVKAMFESCMRYMNMQ